jgi:hypothetical protein
MRRSEHRPITTEQQFDTALSYVVQEVARMAGVVLGRSVTIEVAKLFAHSDEEYDYLLHKVKQNGLPWEGNSASSFYVETRRTIAEHPITLLGVRRPFADRPEVGCADFYAEDYDVLKSAHPANVTEIISGGGAAMLQMQHPDFDVLGYILRR